MNNIGQNMGGSYTSPEVQNRVTSGANAAPKSVNNSDPTTNSLTEQVNTPNYAGIANKPSEAFDPFGIAKQSSASNGKLQQMPNSQGAFDPFGIAKQSGAPDGKLQQMPNSQGAFNPFVSGEKKSADFSVSDLNEFEFDEPEGDQMEMPESNGTESAAPSGSDKSHGILYALLQEIKRVLPELYDFFRLKIESLDKSARTDPSKKEELDSDAQALTSAMQTAIESTQKQAAVESDQKKPSGFFNFFGAGKKNLEQESENDGVENDDILNMGSSAVDDSQFDDFDAER
ncbi:MAG: hypothetical protein LBI69_04750 [Puniceicoccales bacterium]|nr:hypothetical protein [Puniceicoccales bacterium]